MTQRLVEHRLTSKCQRMQIARKDGHTWVGALKPRGVSLTVVADDDPAEMMTLEVYLLEAGDEIPVGVGFVAVADGTFVFAREVAAELTVLTGGGLQ